MTAKRYWGFETGVAHAQTQKNAAVIPMQYTLIVSTPKGTLVRRECANITELATLLDEVARHVHGDPTEASISIINRQS